MHRIIFLSAIFLASCAPEGPGEETAPAAKRGAGAGQANDPAGADDAGADFQWQAETESDGYSLRLDDRATGDHVLVISCRPPGRLTVHAPGFTPIMSEDRFSFGIGSEPVTLVANPYEQEPGAGVTGEGPIPDDLAALFERADSISALYGTQQAGPHPAPPRTLGQFFLDTCEKVRGE